MKGEDGAKLLIAWGRVDVIQKLTSEQSLEGGEGSFETFAISLRDNILEASWRLLKPALNTPGINNGRVRM